MRTFRMARLYLFSLTLSDLYAGMLLSILYILYYEEITYHISNIPKQRSYNVHVD